MRTSWVLFLYILMLSNSLPKHTYFTLQRPALTAVTQHRKGVTRVAVLNFTTFLLWRQSGSHLLVQSDVRGSRGGKGQLPGTTTASQGWGCVARWPGNLPLASYWYLTLHAPREGKGGRGSERQREGVGGVKAVTLSPPSRILFLWKREDCLRLLLSSVNITHSWWLV